MRMIINNNISHLTQLKNVLEPINSMCMLGCVKNMTDNKTSTLLSDVSIEGDIVEKDTLIVDSKINGNIKSGDITTYSNSNIKGNIKSKSVSLGGKIKGNIHAETIRINKTANVDGVLNQKTLSIEEGATLKIKTETNK